MRGLDPIQDTVLSAHDDLRVDAGKLSQVPGWPGQLARRTASSSKDQQTPRLPEQGVDVGLQLPVGVDDLELFLDADRERLLAHLNLPAVAAGNSMPTNRVRNQVVRRTPPTRAAVGTPRIPPTHLSRAPRRRRRKSNKGLGWLGIRGPGPRLVRLALRLGSSPARGR